MSDTLTTNLPGKSPVINAHTHIFIGEQVPPEIAKTFVPWPFYKLITVPLILRVCRFWFLSKLSPKQWKYKRWHRVIKRSLYGYRAFTRRHFITDIFIKLLNLVISYHAVIFFFLWLNGLFIKPDGGTASTMQKVTAWLSNNYLLWFPQQGWVRLLLVLFTLFFIRSGRQMIFFLLKKMWKFLSVIPDKTTLAFLGRYINIGRFAYYKRQDIIYSKLKAQYDNGTGFIVLPMDMEFMGAGKLKEKAQYHHQMEQLAHIKDKADEHTFFPFVFIDPRREQCAGKTFLSWRQGDPGEVLLNDCFVKDYIEDKTFSGFKIYPALGYYPFDTKLLALWKYAADHDIPITTHCIRGTIFYRGKKKKEWGYHPVFRESDGKGGTTSLLLPELKNIDFINNFTHPLNYLCLVEEVVLRKVVQHCGDQAVKGLFGFTDANTPLTSDLRRLKICFGHFGGADEWQRYFEADRDSFTSQLVTKPGDGIEFIKDGKLDHSYHLLESLWKNVDWYSIIVSLILKYDNLYADISFTLHDTNIIPLLKHSIQNEKLKFRILYGTDFYVVRNHKSDKEMLAEMIAGLSEEEFDLLARDNPRSFLKRRLKVEG